MHRRWRKKREMKKKVGQEHIGCRNSSSLRTRTSLLNVFLNNDIGDKERKYIEKKIIR
jgi:hypothetical protein